MLHGAKKRLSTNATGSLFSLSGLNFHRDRQEYLRRHRRECRAAWQGQKGQLVVLHAFMASEDLANAVWGYFLETTPEYSQGRCGLFLETPRDEALFPK